VTSDFDSNECPEGSSEITTEEECQAVTPELGFTYSKQDTWGNQPKGCFVVPTSSATMFNTHATGGAAATSKKVCAQASE